MKSNVLLDALLLDCIELMNGHHQCRHCRHWAHMGDPLIHEDGCVVGQISAVRAGPKANTEWAEIVEEACGRVTAHAQSIKNQYGVLADQMLLDSIEIVAEISLQAVGVKPITNFLRKITK